MEFKIDNVCVYGLENSLRASGNHLRVQMEDLNSFDEEKALKRANKLSSTNIGEGHDQFLTGIVFN